jgi:hypothetical protein
MVMIPDPFCFSCRIGLKLDVEFHIVCRLNELATQVLRAFGIHNIIGLRIVVLCQRAIAVVDPNGKAKPLDTHHVMDSETNTQVKPTRRIDVALDQTCGLFANGGVLRWVPERLIRDGWWLSKQHCIRQKPKLCEKRVEFST